MATPFLVEPEFASASQIRSPPRTARHRTQTSARPTRRRLGLAAKPACHCAVPHPTRKSREPTAGTRLDQKTTSTASNTHIASMFTPPEPLEGTIVVGAEDGRLLARKASRH